MATELDHDREKTIRERFPAYPFPAFLGMEIDTLGYGTARLVMKFANELTQGAGVIHGGAITSLCDTAVGVAVYTMTEKGELIFTVELKVNFIAPADGDIFADATIIHKGRRTAVGDVDVRKNDGSLVARGLITYYINRD